MAESERFDFREEFKAAFDAVGKMFERSRPGRGESMWGVAGRPAGMVRRGKIIGFMTAMED